MNQLSLFNGKKTKKSSKNSWHLYTDGASRNNPGPAGAGIYLLRNNKPVLKKSFYLGSKTNNEAEYLALLFGVLLAKKEIAADDALEIILDSQLLVRQCIGEYKVKKDNLKPLHAAVKNLLVDVNYSFKHVMRDENVHADKLANQGIDKKIIIPDELITELQRYEIAL